MNWVNPEYPEVGACRIEHQGRKTDGWRIESWASINRVRVTRGDYILELPVEYVEVRDE